MFQKEISRRKIKLFLLDFRCRIVELFKRKKMFKHSLSFTGWQTVPSVWIKSSSTVYNQKMHPRSRRKKRTESIQAVAGNRETDDEEEEDQDEIHQHRRRRDRSRNVELYNPQDHSNLSPEPNRSSHHTSYGELKIESSTQRINSIEIHWPWFNVQSFLSKFNGRETVWDQWLMNDILLSLSIRQSAQVVDKQSVLIRSSKIVGSSRRKGKESLGEFGHREKLISFRNKNLFLWPHDETNEFGRVWCSFSWI